VPAKVIGVMRMLDNGEADDKIIAVAAGDPSVSHIKDISELPQHFISELRHFFEEYKTLEHKAVVVEEFLEKKVAQNILNQSLAMYKDMF
ncbi:MAG: inorganic diphosphatase, partial [Nitrospira sp.]|nr:inorganic diphosphatase [Nitrospira sp.]